MVVNRLLQMLEVDLRSGDALVTKLGADHVDVVAGRLVQLPGEHVAQRVNRELGGLLGGPIPSGSPVQPLLRATVDVVAAQQALENAVGRALRDVAIGGQAVDVGKVGTAGDAQRLPDVLVIADVAGAAGVPAALEFEVGDNGVVRSVPAGGAALLRRL